MSPASELQSLTTSEIAQPPAPFLRWAGSKRKLLPELVKYFPRDVRYVEPFMGSACLYFALQPPAAVLSDLNGELVELYETVRDAPAEVYKRLCQIPRTAVRYYRIRAMNPRRMKPLNRAVRFLYLNRNCFNGLYRTNTRGEFNVPFSDSRVGGYPSWPEFRAASDALGRARVLAGDFEDVLMHEVRPGDFVYLDPPYAVENIRVFKQYGPQIFGEDDLNRLTRVLRELTTRGASFVLSYAACPEAIRAFHQWPQRTVQTQRNIAGFAKHRRRDSELIVSNLFPVDGTHSPNLAR